MDKSQEVNEEINQGEEMNDNVGNLKEEATGNKSALDLKVKADSTDISPEDRKRNVKKLAGAIAHSLRSSGEVNVRAFGAAAIGKATKALAIAKDYIGKKYDDSKTEKMLQLSCSPAFITSKIGGNVLTGISFVTFANPKSNSDDIDLEKVNSVLMVKADAKDIDPEDRKRNVKKLAGAISHSLAENKECFVRCFGNSTISKASKAIAISRGHVAVRGYDLYTTPYFIVAQMGPEKQERTGIGFYIYTNE